MFMAGGMIFLSILSANLFTRWSDFYLVLFILIAPLFICYTLISEIFFDGQTLGKRFTGLKVVKLNGDAPSAQDYFTRWLFRALDIWASLGSIAALLVSSSNKSQRIGDLLSGTTVIRLGNQSRNFTLDDILKIPTTESYQPTYPQVVLFKEQDMLLVKKTMERAKKYPNEAHQKTLDKLCKRLAQELELKQIPADKTLFLKTLISDYVALTR
jgi:uncharacterized RDD family membrane protein YckC